MNLGSLVSEARNPQTLDLDALSTLELVNRFNQQDTLVALAVKETLPEVAKAVDAAAAALKAGGRIIYMGAGTSGRLGVLDASECPPTFGVPHGLVVGLIAGGPGALLKAVEGAEDSKQLGEDDLKALNLTAQDLVVGLAASGRTPYVIGGWNTPDRPAAPRWLSPVTQVRRLRRLLPLQSPGCRARSAYRLHASEIRNGTKAGAQYDFHGSNGEVR
jgi:N-acetylmuramic acid 6-phosphate etherase